ncbi:hypothetical protein JCM4914_51150 [Streptomyces platensis subsp. malvinus]
MVRAQLQQERKDLLAIIAPWSNGPLLPPFGRIRATLPRAFSPPTSREIEAYFGPDAVQRLSTEAVPDEGAFPRRAPQLAHHRRATRDKPCKPTAPSARGPLHRGTRMLHTHVNEHDAYVIRTYVDDLLSSIDPQGARYEGWTRQLSAGAREA